MLEITEDLGNAMREGMRRLASGVCIITAKDGDDDRIAMTASSVTSVSDLPPSLLVCVNKKARMEPILGDQTEFAVNILGADHEELSNMCASSDQSYNRFSVGDWREDEQTGLPYLGDALAVFICRKQQLVPYGSHSIFIGDIQAVKVNEPPFSPLVYVNGSYHYL